MNLNDSYPYCDQYYRFTCDQLDLSTCNMRETHNRTSLTLDYEELTYDEDGCFDSRLLKLTQYYKNYQKFSITMGLITLVLGSVGLVGNLTSILVLSQQEMRNCFNQLLIALNTCDSLYLVVAILEVLRTDFPTAYHTIMAHQAIYPYLQYPFYRILMCAGIYMMIGVGIERYLAVCRPHHYRELQVRSNRALFYILPSITIAVLINIPRFFDIEPFLRCLDKTDCGCSFEQTYLHKPTNLRLNTDYIIYYVNWTMITLTGIIPFSILMFLNWSIYHGMKMVKRNLNKNTPNTRTVGGAAMKAVAISQSALAAENTDIGDGASLNNKETRRRKRASQQSKECNLAIILICTVATFFLCHLPRVLTSVYEAVNIYRQQHCTNQHKDSFGLWYLYSIVGSNMLLILNCSSNLPIYLFVGKSFRSAFNKLFGLEKLSLAWARATGKIPTWKSRNRNANIPGGIELQPITHQ